MATLVLINEKTAHGRHYLKILKVSPEFATVFGRYDQKTLDNIKKVDSGEGKKHKTVK